MSTRGAVPPRPRAIDFILGLLFIGFVLVMTACMGAGIFGGP